MEIEHSKPVPPFVKFCAANIPMVFDDSLSYYEALCALWKWLQTDVIDVINNNATATEAYRDEVYQYKQAVDQLHDYVENYFTNLDVQEEINNKLDQMAEDGTLAEIIGDYLNATAVWGFDTVADMQDATNLINGSYAKTLGFYAKNDGGEAVYKIRNITNDDVIDGASIIEMNDSGNQLVAELILTDPINVKTFGAYGDDTHDDTQAIQKAINYGFSKGIYTVFLPNGTYKTTDPIYLLEKCELRGENKDSAIIHKTGNGTGSVSGINADAIIILADSTYATGTTVSTDVRNSEKINNLKLNGNIDSYVSGKSDAQKQYAIWCIGYAPKTAIDNISISGVDVGIEAKGMYVSHISDIFGLHAFYAGIKITVESQGIIVSNINTLATHDVGIMLSGATYGSMQACLVEWAYGGYAYRFSNWHGEMNGCGYELGDGPHIGISAVDSKISLVGGYFYSGSPNENNNIMIDLAGSSFTLRDSVIGTYNQSIQYDGKFFNLYNSNIVIDETNKFLGSFAQDSTGSGTAFCTINGKTYDVLRDNILLSSGPTNASDKYDYIDSDFNSTKKHPRTNIYSDNVSNPMTNSVNGYNAYAPAYNKGDIGFYKNAYATGKLGWFCNRDNHSDLAESAGTISAVADNSITLTDPFTANFSNTGTRFFVNCKIKGLTSNATARISWISNAQFGITEKSGTFQVGEKIQMVSENFCAYADYLSIPLILAGTTMYRPATSVSIGTMYFDTTLNKPIWYKGSNTWVDATGATV